MDNSLIQSVCRYTGNIKTRENATDFRVCLECTGITHKTRGTEDLLTRGAFRCSYCGATLPNYINLVNKINEVNTFVAGVTIGELEGNYAQPDLDTLNAALAVANGLIIADVSTQEQVITATTTLDDAFIVFKASKITE